ncbi:MAG: 5-(carboxyamino)imidazole ribonucleotide synthase [Cyanobacteria bacterium]|nr:5-(carboxyamino)imidazole ribonucleotide synthase [Cyanobacteriota bacterium]
MILPGSWIGLLGGGQLGRMFTTAAQTLGYSVCVLCPEADAPAGQVAQEHIIADYLDAQALSQLSKKVQVITLEFENIPAQALDFLQKNGPVYPQKEILAITQNRLLEKEYLQGHGFEVTPFHRVHTWEDLKVGLEKTNFPAVLKTAGFGYDGKGQKKIRSWEEAQNAFPEFEGQPLILEQFIPYLTEFSVIAARNQYGEFRAYPVFENFHQNHILDVSVCPSSLSEDCQHQARHIAQQVFDAFGAVGVMCIEFFLTQSHQLLINEIAPRPHNSGHLTLEASVTSQFEQQVRAVCGLPLGDTSLLQPAAMANLLGELWPDNRQSDGGQPDWENLMAQAPSVKLHLYGKSTPHPGRKMGHLTSLASSVELAKEKILLARKALHP